MDATTRARVYNDPIGAARKANAAEAAKTAGPRNELAERHRQELAAFNDKQRRASLKFTHDQEAVRETLRVSGAHKPGNFDKEQKSALDAHRAHQAKEREQFLARHEAEKAHLKG